jgi:hypothetical protein
LADAGLVASGTWQGDCVFTFDSQPQALAVSAMSPDPEIAERFSSSGAPAAAHLIVVYRNNTEATLGELSLRLPAPHGTEISAEADGDALSNGALQWDLKDLAPGDVGRVRLTVRLLSSDAETVALAPEITAGGTRSTRSDPATLAVIR